METSFDVALSIAKEKGVIVVLEKITGDDYCVEDMVFSVFKDSSVVYGYVNYETLRAFIFGFAANKED